MSVSIFDTMYKINELIILINTPSIILIKGQNNIKGTLKKVKVNPHFSKFRVHLMVVPVVEVVEGQWTVACSRMRLFEDGGWLLA